LQLSKTATWLAGIFILFFILGLNRGVFLLKAEHATGEVIGSQLHRRRAASRTYHVRFEHEGNSYTFWTSQFASCKKRAEVPVIFDPSDPENAYENSFGGSWLWGLIYIAIAFVPWSAAALSFIDSDERLVIGWKTIGRAKMPAKK
jgi:hypothetical protein